MKCPECKSRSVSVKEGDGFSQDTRECGKCGIVWTFRGGELVIIGKPKQVAVIEKAFTFPPVLDHTRFSTYEDEFVAEDQKVWFS